mmetsp:Transcript_27023/g.84085  ORF Transcript_27023/g.84085 Transcript_27023/m.84085 type:complete len:299 (-) Transcript_27023:1316-2212(-)
MINMRAKLDRQGTCHVKNLRQAGRRPPDEGSARRAGMTAGRQARKHILGVRGRGWRAALGGSAAGRSAALCRGAAAARAVRLGNLRLGKPDGRARVALAHCGRERGILLLEPPMQQGAAGHARALGLQDDAVENLVLPAKRQPRPPRDGSVVQPIRAVGGRARLQPTVRGVDPLLAEVLADVLQTEAQDDVEAALGDGPCEGGQLRSRADVGEDPRALRQMHVVAQQLHLIRLHLHAACGVVELPDELVGVIISGRLAALARPTHGQRVEHAVEVARLFGVLDGHQVGPRRARVPGKG